MSLNLGPQPCNTATHPSLLSHSWLHRWIQAGLKPPAGLPIPFYQSASLGSADPPLPYKSMHRDRKCLGNGAWSDWRLLCYSFWLAPWLCSLLDLLVSWLTPRPRAQTGFLASWPSLSLDFACPPWLVPWFPGGPDPTSPVPVWQLASFTDPKRLNQNTAPRVSVPNQKGRK